MWRSTKALPWLPTILGILALIVGLTIAAAKLRQESPKGIALSPAPQPEFTLPGVASGPQVPVSLLPSPSPSDRATADEAEPDPSGPATVPQQPRPEATSTTTATATTAPRREGPLSGRYRVLNSYGDNFIGEVLVDNATGQERDWTVVVTVPAGVGKLRTSWLESLPQPTLKSSGRTYTWRSSVPLAARGKGALRFQFERTGADKPPTRCTVNGSACRD